MVTKETLLVTVRTYPNVSTKYMETVCTGGITEAGEWRRLYPVPLRYLDEGQQYSTYDVIELSVEEGRDGRSETRRPNCQTIRVVRTERDWVSRCNWINPTILPSLKALTDSNRTIGPVAVREVRSFEAYEIEKEWSPKHLELMKQDGLFFTRKPLDKIPFEFRFQWIDEDGAEHDSMALAWEFGQTWRQYTRRYPDAIDRMRDKWMNDLCSPKRKISFYMGNSAEHRHIFMICGIFSPPTKIGAVPLLF